jgi:dTDP-4-dehydrorhamnose reductase
VTGCRGLLGSLFMERLGGSATGADLPELDLTSGRDSLSAAVRGSGAEIVINCAAITDVDRCQTEPGAAYRLHCQAVADLVEVSPALITFSTDQVFTGPGERPWIETDPVTPANEYARSKLAGEEAALAHPGAVVIRTSWLFGAGRGMPSWIRERLIRQGRVRAVCDQTACLTWAPDLVEAALSLAGRPGLFHAVNPGPTTPYDLASSLAGSYGGAPEPVTWAELGLPAPRPVYSALGSCRGLELPPVSDALRRWRELDA